jgi:hypothetical protein
MGLRDDTLIIYVVGDNGPSGEGSLTGTLNNMKTQLGLLDDVSFMLEAHRRDRRPPAREPLPVGWCWAGSSPFQWMKQVGVALRRNAQRPGHVVAQGHRRPRRPALAVPPLHRPRADDPRGRPESPSRAK